MEPNTPDSPKNRPLSPENPEIQSEKHALLDPESVRSKNGDKEEKKESITLKNFKAKVMELAQESRMTVEQKQLIEHGFRNFFPDLHVPNHPPYALMIQRAIRELNEAGGSTEVAISHFITKEENDLPWAHATLLAHHLQKLCEKGDIVVTKKKQYMLNTNQWCREITPSPVSSSSPSSSSTSASDYDPRGRTRQRKRKPKKRSTESRKYVKVHRRERNMRESEDEYEDTEEEKSEESEEEEEFDDTDQENENMGEEFHETEREVQLIGVETDAIKYQELKQIHCIEGNVAKKQKESEFGDEHMSVIAFQNQVSGACETIPVKSTAANTCIGPKEDTQVQLIKAQNQKDPTMLKRGRGRPSKNNRKKTEEDILVAHTGIQKRPYHKRKSRTPSKTIEHETVIGLKEVMESADHVTGDLKMPKEKRGRGRPPKIIGVETNIVHEAAEGAVTKTHNQVVDGMEKSKQKKGRGRPPKNSEGQLEVSGDGMKSKRQRRWRRRKYDSEEIKQLDQLEVVVVENMFERMAIQLCNDGENDLCEMLPIILCKPRGSQMEDKEKDEKENQIEGSVERVELSNELNWTQHLERSQEDLGKSSLNSFQLPQKGIDDEPYCLSDFQASKTVADEHKTNIKEMAPPQLECVGQDGIPKFEQVTTNVSLDVPSYHHDGCCNQVQVLGTELETTTFMELLHSEYQQIVHDQQPLDQPKILNNVSSTPTYCDEGDDKNLQCNK